MYTDSNNRYDIFTWIKTIIHSSESIVQCSTCSKLIRTFYRQFKDDLLKDTLLKENNTQLKKIRENGRKHQKHQKQ